MVVVGEVVIFVLLEGPLHDLEQLSFAGVVDFPDFGLDFVEPHFDGVELRGVGGQVHDVDVPLFGQLHGLLLVVDGAVVHDEPLLPVLVVPELVEFLEELLDEVEVLILAVGALDDAPVGESLLADDGNEGEALALGDGAVHSDLLVGTGPGLLAGHVEVEPRLIQEVDLSVLVQQLLVLRRELIPLLQRLRSVLLLGHATHSFLPELPCPQKPRDCGFVDLLALAVLEALEVLDFVELDTDFALGHERVLLDQACDMLESFDSQLLLRSLLPEVVPYQTVVESRVIHPFSIQLVNRVGTDVE